MEKKRQRRRVTELPRLTAMLFCDGVGKDPNSGKTTLYGLFDRVLAKDEPINLRCVVFARMVGGKGLHDFSLNLTNKRGKQILKIELGEGKECKPGQKMDIYCQIAGVELPKPGEYVVFVTSGTKPVGEPLILPVVMSKESDKATDG